ncbi:MAG TPA: hypothetical protein VLH19_04465, partial [Patescibacteria group bacterium]|nr:hypothetical protein [Patescibacteria group bacterium]
MMKKVSIALGTLGALALSTSTVFADTSVNIDAGAAGFKISDLGKLIQSLLSVVLAIVGLLVFVYLIWGGVEWITAGGDKSKTESARQKITNAIIGLAIVAAAFAISKVLGSFFGIN